jgi:chromosome segregation ATPase
MSTVEELRTICEEFQQNFSTLSIRYNNLQQEVEAERVSKLNQQRQLEAAERQCDKAMAGMRELKSELQEAVEYREKYRAAAVTIEHMKGRLETARRSVGDSVVEHDQMTEQLRGQIQDLVQRIEVSTDAKQMSELRCQVRELEERAAILSGQVIEERERHSQQQLSSNSALRELHARNVELEQRYRSMESEVTQMRSAVRRSMDLQNDAAMQREKALLDVRSAQSDATAAQRQVQEIADRLAHLQAKHEKDIEELRAAFDEERVTLAGRLSSAVSERNDAVAARELEEERHSALQRSVQKKISAARETIGEEIDAVHKRLGEERDEKLRIQARLRLLEQQASESQRSLDAAESRVIQLEQEKTQLRAQAERAVQQEAWFQVEKDHALAQLQAQRTRVEELSTFAKQVETLTLENDKLKLSLQYKDADVADARRDAEHVALQLRATEETCDKRCMALHKQSKQLKKQLSQEILRSEAQRKKMMSAILAKETQLQSKHRNAPLADIGHLNHRQISPVSPHCGEFDALSILRPLDEQAAHLHDQIAALTHKGTTGPIRPL